MSHFQRTSLLQVMSALPVAVIAHDLERKIFFFNEEAEKITGYSREEVLGKDCHEVFDGGFCGNKCMFKQDTEFLEFRKLSYNLQFARRDGHMCYLEMKVSPFFDAEKRMQGVVAVFENITPEIYFQTHLEDVCEFHGIIGKTEKMLRLYQQIRNVSRINVPVLILGESGTGKELVAQVIHKLSPRSTGPFVAVNCGALPDSLIESELFGYVKGAFTGAVRNKKGRFELAHGGTLFLDEIGDISPFMQVKLLRAIQSYHIERLGDTKQLRVDVRIISATNKDLQEEIRQGNFREDLYYRLSVIPIHIPPLRERREDIPLLVDHFLKEFSTMFNIPPHRITPSALRMLSSYSWPGNIRELQNVLQYALVEAQEDSNMTVDVCHLPPYIQESTVDRKINLNPPSPGARGLKKDLSPEIIKEAIEKAGGNKAKAAKLLGISRATLYRLLSRLNREQA